MNRKSIQMFAAGLFAAACCASVYYFTQQPADNQEEAVTEKILSKEEAIVVLEEQGYNILTNSEVADLKEQSNRKVSSVKALLTITEGMSSSTVVSSLSKLGMIDDERNFQHRLQESGAATKIQAGVYEINDQMSEEEIINLITS
ncbi:endolytic transglycosylase MltG [Bacillus piscicola]|uniref:endolytic transglycosylase MltG n=1 Tax=Bacillus piscicola TaxID=1632684 RepID=UPI001F09AFB9|nr:endolytic transglycosylase MltG [Bacillus piscicola]